MRHLIAVLAASVVGGVVAYGCSSSSGNGGGPTGDGGSSADVVTHKEASGPYDSSGSTGDDSSGGSCPTPADVSKFTPPAYEHAKHDATACTAQMLTDFDSECLNATTRNTATCSTWKTTNATCYGCLVSVETDATWGPLVSHNGLLSINSAGCVELTDPADTTCAPADQAEEACLEAACDSTCPVTSAQTSYTNYTACINTAAAEGCSTFVSAVSPACGSVTAAAQPCLPANYSTFEPYFFAIAPYFCGGAPTDGGTEGGSEGGGATEGGAESGAGDAAGD